MGESKKDAFRVEVLVSRSLFYEILERIKRLKPVLTG